MSTGRRRAAGRGSTSRKRSEKSRRMQRQMRDRMAAGEALERIRKQEGTDHGQARGEA